MRKLSALLLSSVYSKDNLSASGTPCPLHPAPPSLLESNVRARPVRSINFWQTTRKWNRKRKQNNAKKRKEKITAQSGETRVSEIDGGGEGAGVEGRAGSGADFAALIVMEVIGLWSWQTYHSVRYSPPPLAPSYPLFSLSFGGFYFI